MKPRRIGAAARPLRNYGSLLVAALLVGGSVGALAQAPAGGAQVAADIYQERCATCHGTKGQGTNTLVPPTGPALKGNPFIVNAPGIIIKSVIRNGREGRQRLYHDIYPNMPSFGPEMIPDVNGLIAYLKGDLQAQ